MLTLLKVAMPFTAAMVVEPLSVALPLAIDKKMEFWPAMEVSRQVVHRHWWSAFALVIVLWLLAMLGSLACFVGLLITVPIANAALMYVYEDLFGEPVASIIVEPTVTV